MAGPSPHLDRRSFLVLAGSGVAVIALGKGLSAMAASEPTILANTAPTGNPPAESEPSSASTTAPNGTAAGDGTAAEGTPAATDTPTTSPQGDVPTAALQQEAAPTLTLDDLPWNLRLVNREHPLPEDFPKPTLGELPGGHGIDKRACKELKALLAAAEKAGCPPVICSSYRSHKRQRELYRNRVAQSKREGKRGQEARDDAAFWVAPPYASEHEAGLAVDLVDADYQELDEEQEATATQKWLIAHCTEFGFILRYPTDKSALTGIGYEPWHYRYVGKEAASAIAASGLCLEEWLEKYLASTLA